MLFVSENKDWHHLQATNEARFKDFLDYVMMACCHRCYHGQSNRPNFHHHGGLFHLLSQPPRVAQAYFDRWTRDEEHGFAHGLVTAFLAHYLLPAATRQLYARQVTRDSRRDTELTAERLLLGCVVHDFCRGAGMGEPHDIGLEGVFGGLRPVVYRHAAPRPEDENDVMVAADRLELLRYPDHAEWVDRAKIDMNELVYGWRALRHFYAHLRPAIQAVLAHRRSPWVSHVPELGTSLTKSVFPDTHWVPHDSAPGWRPKPYPGSARHFSVNTGYLTDPCLWQNFRDTQAPAGWKGGWLMGLMPRDTVRAHGADVVANPPTSWGRDHGFVKYDRKLPFEKWVMVYNNIKDVPSRGGRPIAAISAALLQRLLRVADLLLGRIDVLKVG